MATENEMIRLFCKMEEQDKGWIGKTVWKTTRRHPHIFYDIMWRALYVAEDEGSCHNDYYGGKFCTCWRVGDYNIYYVTDDEDFSVTMLTEEMMDDLIIEEDSS